MTFRMENLGGGANIIDSTLLSRPEAGRKKLKKVPSRSGGGSATSIGNRLYTRLLKNLGGGWGGGKGGWIKGVFFFGFPPPSASLSFFFWGRKESEEGVTQDKKNVLTSRGNKLRLLPALEKDFCALKVSV